jgi:hypothetical protein
MAAYMVFLTLVDNKMFLQQGIVPTSFMMELKMLLQTI